MHLDSPTAIGLFLAASVGCSPPFFDVFGLVFVVVGLLVAGVGPHVTRLLGPP